MPTLEKPELTQRQIANKANAQLSTGAKTPEGKAKVAMNAIKHGFSAKAHIVIPGESTEEFHDFQRSFLEHFDPADPMQLELVDRIVISAWKLRRLAKTEGDYLRNPRKRYAGHEPLPYDDRELFIHLQRYETNIEGSFHRAIAAITKLQKEAAKTNPTGKRWTWSIDDSLPKNEFEKTNPIPKPVREFPFIEEPSAETNPTDEPTPEAAVELPTPNQQTAKTNPITNNPMVILCETSCNSVIQVEPKTPINDQLASEKTNPTTTNSSVSLCETSCNSVVKSNAETSTNQQPANSRDLSDVDQFLLNKANVSLQDINPDSIETYFCACHKTKQAIIALTRAREELGMSRRDIARMIGVSVETTARIEFNKESPFELIVRYARAVLNPL